jgi:hypothetical protein
MIIDFDESYESVDSSATYESAPKKKYKGPLALSALVVVGALFLQNTLAANISLGTGANLEFGQGVQVTAACSGSDVLTLTPYSSFVNSSGSGSYYLNSVKVSGIPASCNGVDFNISVFDSTTSTALPIFATSKTVASVWNNAGTFQIGSGSTGSSVTSGSGTFTITFTSPVALASGVSRVTLQSVSHAAYSCAADLVCEVGDISPSGGTIFYKSVTAFTETGTVCASDCHYLEYAPLSWYPGNDDGSFNFSYNGASKYGIPVTTGTKDALGAGYNNTALIIAAGDTQGAHARARAYVGPYANTTGEWFIPSRFEMNEIWDSTAKSSGGFRPSEYHVSVQDEGSQRCKSINFLNRSNNSQGCTGANPYRARPIRAF